MIKAGDALVLGDYFCSGHYHQSLDIMPKAKTGITDILLYLALLPACCRVAEARLEHERSNQGAKTRIDLALLVTPELIHSGRHVVVDVRRGIAPSAPAQALGMRIKQRLVRAPAADRLRSAMPVSRGSNWRKKVCLYYFFNKFLLKTPTW